MFPLRIVIALGLFTQTASANPTEEMRMLGNCAECVVANEDHSSARLLGIDLTDSHLTGIRFSQAAMSVAVLNGATLTDVSFDGADLRGVSFVNARLSNVTFEGADLTGAVFEGAVLVDSDLSTGRLCKTQLPDDTMANDGCSTN